MKLYLVRAQETEDDRVEYDTHAGAVIAARNELHALELFGQHCTPDEGFEYTTTLLTPSIDAGIILSDFRAG